MATVMLSSGQWVSDVRCDRMQPIAVKREDATVLANRAPHPTTPSHCFPNIHHIKKKNSSISYGQIIGPSSWKPIYICKSQVKWLNVVIYVCACVCVCARMHVCSARMCTQASAWAAIRIFLRDRSASELVQWLTSLFERRIRYVRTLNLPYWKKSV